MSMKDTACFEGFARLCSDAWLQGWHERNGGNLSYRMTVQDLEQCAPYFDEQPDAWHKLDERIESIAGEYFIMTGSGKFMRNVESSMEDACAVLQINDAGDAYRKVWGLVNGGRPSSELPTHLMSHGIRKTVTNGADHVIYHAHCPEIITLSTMVEPSTYRYTHILWKSMTECIIVFPEGVGVVPWMVPGGIEIARETYVLMQTHAAVIWCQHGMFVSGKDFDDAFSLMHTIEKSAYLYINARAALGGAEPLCTLSDDQLRAVCKAYDVKPNKDLLSLE